VTYDAVRALLERRGATCKVESPAIERWHDPHYPHPLILHRLLKDTVDVYTADTPPDLEQLEQLLDSERVLRD
jgi:hypothetical protein